MAPAYLLWAGSTPTCLIIQAVRVCLWQWVGSSTCCNLSIWNGQAKHTSDQQALLVVLDSGLGHWASGVVMAISG